MNRCKIRFTILFLFLGIIISNAQDPNRFKEQVEKLYNKEYNFGPDKKRVVFAGSSSIRMWKDVQEYFPDYKIINNGFGGSHYSDLIFYYDKLILKQNPEILFIYEGDNDIASHKKPSKVSKEAKALIQKIQTGLPETRVVLISPKPCIARWELKKDYEKLNKRLYKLSKRTDNVEYADVWNNMLDEKGIVLQDIFIEDGVHMNKKGYDLWAKIISDYLE
jgi:lysophospholipase L1-like esterase